MTGGRDWQDPGSDDFLRRFVDERPRPRYDYASAVSSLSHVTDSTGQPRGWRRTALALLLACATQAPVLGADTEPAGEAKAVQDAPQTQRGAAPAAPQTQPAAVPAAPQGTPQTAPQSAPQTRRSRREIMREMMKQQGLSEPKRRTYYERGTFMITGSIEVAKHIYDGRELVRSWIERLERLWKPRIPLAARMGNGGRVTYKGVLSRGEGMRSLERIESSGLDSLDEAAQIAIEEFHSSFQMPDDFPDSSFVFYIQFHYNIYNESDY